MKESLCVYLGGPEVFLHDAQDIGNAKKELCARYGFRGMFPLDNEVKQIERVQSVDLEIYRANIRTIQVADFGILNLTPFRSPSADVGTVFELGMLIALGKQVFAYSNDARNLLERVKITNSAHFDIGRHVWVCDQNMRVEDFDNCDNLMIDNALSEQGCGVVRTNVVGYWRYRDLVAFEECLKQAAYSFSESQ